MRRLVRRVAGAVVLIAVAGALFQPGGELNDLLEGARDRVTTAVEQPGGLEATPEDVRAAVDALELLETAPLTDRQDYDRDHYGQRWADVDRNGCDQRNDALRAGAAEGSLELKPGTNGCVVLSATIPGPYTGEDIEFVKGENTVDIDHVVPLSRAWRQGASEWPASDREEFANEALNLVAVDASTNREKGDAGPEEWMPPAGRCGYAVRWVQVKEHWDLTVTDQEKDVLASELERCEGRVQ